MLGIYTGVQYVRYVHWLFKDVRVGNLLTQGGQHPPCLQSSYAPGKGITLLFLGGDLQPVQIQLRMQL